MNATAADEPGRWPEVERRQAPRDGADAGDASRRREVVLITGISGSGKSVALHALEDAGFFCVDNLPPELLRDFIRLEHERFTHRVAVAVDVRNAVSLPQLRAADPSTCRPKACTCVRCFSTPAPTRWCGAFPKRAVRIRCTATRRGRRRVARAGRCDRAGTQLLAALREVSTVIDTSQLRPAQLRAGCATWSVRAAAS